MRLPLLRQFAILVSIILTHLTSYNFVRAATFDQQEVDQSSFIAVARPYGNNQYDLLILQQIPQQRQCWSENGSKLVKVEPLLLNFDFTGSCERSTDSNGYSVRIDGQDYGLNYLLRIVKRKGELVLVATNRVNPSQKEIVIGRTYGMAEGFLKIYLNPGWRFTKRSYQGQILGHVYLTGDTQAMIPEESSSIISSNLSNIESASTSLSESSQEYTFTAESSDPLVASTTDSFSDNSSASTLPSYESSLVTRNNSENLESSTKINTGDLPPPPFSPSSLPPIAPPSQNPNSQIVPPPSLNSPNSQRQSLSDVLSNFNGNPTPTSSTPSVAQARGYKVLASAKTGSQQQKLRSLYPEAFPTKYNGQSFWQVGVFSTSDNAQTVIQTLKNAGLNGKMIPF